MMLLSEIKAEMRRVVLARRDGLTPAARAQASAQLAARAAALGDIDGLAVSGFWPIRSEIDPRPLMSRLAAGGAALALPAIVDRQTIVFRRYDPDQPLQPSGFGTMAPPPDAETVAPDLLLAPLAAFDDFGNRLGYGAGHYDRAVAGLRRRGHRARLIGLAFAIQHVAAIPTGPHDVAMDGVLTENGLHGFAAQR